MRWLKILVFGGGGLLATWIILRVTGMLQFYSIPTSSNEPAIPAGSYIFSSNLITPERGDFICYKHQVPGYGLNIWAKRLCGMPGDTLQIKEGVLYINGKNADEGRNLKFAYKIPAGKIYGLKIPREDMRSYWGGADSAIVLMDTERAKRLRGVKQLTQPGQGSVAAQYDPAWTVDFFGPYIVPKGHYFVMGDSRHNSEDSRYTGPIPTGDVVGVVLGK